MARRQLLSNEAWAARLAPVVDDREVIRHYTLSEDDFDAIMRKRLDASRLGYALALCLMRHPGRSLEQGEALPVQIVGYVARQLGIAPGVFDNSPERDKERRKHLTEAMRRFGYRPFDRAVLKDLIGWLTPSAQVTRAAEPLIDIMIGELRRRQILLPSPRILELAVHQARQRGERIIHEALIGILPPEKRAALDELLAIRPETTVTQLAWLQNVSRSPAARNILRIIDRLQVIRELALDRRLAERVPALLFERLAAEGRRMTAQHIRDLTTGRRHAVLFATVVALETELTDATLFMFDKLMGSLARRAENKTAARAADTVRDMQKSLRTVTTTCRIMLRAIDSKQDVTAAITKAGNLADFARSLADVETLTAPDMTGNKADLIGRYATVRQFAPKLLDTFTFHGSGSSAGLLKAVALIGDLYRMGKRALPATIPTGFVKREWRPFVFKDGAIDRKAYELCVLSELRGRLAAGEVWVERSRQYQAFEANLIPKPTFDLLKASGSLPVAVNLDGEAWIAERRAALDAELSRVARLAEAEQLQDVDLKSGEVKITPLTAITPDAAKTLKVRVDALLPRIRITDLLIEVDAWTGFSACFTHQRSGRAIENKTTLLTAILADGVNLGLTRMADVCEGANLPQLAWAHDWHIRDETYSAALARLVDAQSALPLAQIWGEGKTSSSDGQYFQAGGHGEAIADVNARHGDEPGVSFYTHVSDRFSPYHTKVIAATASEAPHVLDGLLNHQSGLRIEEHYTDTGGATDHVFGLCHVLGFRFAPRMRDIKDRRLHVFPGSNAPPILAPLVGGFIDADHIAANWSEILRLATSIRSGAVQASAMLKKLSGYPRQNGLAVALREIGRIERSLFMLGWYSDPELRRRTGLGLNKGEARNTLARAIFFNRLGELRDRSFENQAYRASGLNLIVAAIILWNTQYLAPAFAELGRRGHDVSPELIRHVAPLGWQHIALTGDYTWNLASPLAPDALRPLRNESSILAA
jgi:TnpA family transposase